ncbi:ESX secretion-associated protein EspG [Nocardia sp. NPDC050406]|uniref:ESX secretion-associated protein EspG n=1 Tax=Nocardia sp. NPDC050406 TaxID=3364318 RepID=UPI0037A85657
MRWELTDVEFRTLSNRYFDGFMPPPLVFSSRTDSYDEFQRELIETEARLRERLDPGFNSVIDTLVRPEVLIYSSAWCDGDLENPKKRIRVHGARRGRRAVMVTQAPGETIYHSGGFTVTECEPEELPALMIAELPDTEAGRGPALPIVFEARPSEGERNSHSFAFDSFDDSVETRSQAWWAIPAEMSGAIRVLQARSKYGPRGIMELTLLWRDLPDDGRYLIEMETLETKAEGASKQRLADRLEHRVNLVLAHMEERGEETE